ncbi:MAG: hypothetical protein OEY38_10435 [Gammaproteobacteria bacterium]|nr:hypothetical protein [Gammaproteobacteria bacterium]
MKKHSLILFFLLVGFFMLSTSHADTPKSLDSTHGHGINVSGKINLFRVQEKGLELGAKDNFLDAEILVTLDSHPGQVFGIALHEIDPAKQAMVETIRAAYLNGAPVTIQHRRDVGKTNFRIIWVQLGGNSAVASN